MFFMFLQRISKFRRIQRKQKVKLIIYISLARLYVGWGVRYRFGGILYVATVHIVIVQFSLDFPNRIDARKGPVPLIMLSYYFLLEIVIINRLFCKVNYLFRWFLLRTVRRDLREPVYAQYQFQYCSCRLNSKTIQNIPFWLAEVFIPTY